IESLTDQIEQKAVEYLNKIDELGGAAKAIEKGYIQKEIQDSAYKYQKEIEAGERIVVGVNKFQIKESAPKGLLKVDPKVGELQQKKLAELRKIRDNTKVDAALEKLENAAKGEDNLMPFILDAVKAYATLGEICGVLRKVFGEYQQSIVL
ncbi:MAG TPA: methylmalonyl-CoA mutase family protein, partial [Bacillota bacterium]|nr:methylmalonyl-CoA mutase family protein [Bacillota bacterium]